MTTLQTTLELRIETDNFFEIFSELAFHSVSSPDDYVRNWHISLICSALAYHRLGSVEKVNLPPRTFKTFLCSVVYPLFYAVEHQAVAITILTGNATARADVSGRLIELLTSRFIKFYPDLGILDVKNGIKLRNGSTIDVGVYGRPMSSRGFDLCIIDDPQTFKSVVKEEHRTQAKSFLSQSVLSKRKNAQARILLVQSRLHFDDLTGYVSRSLVWQGLSLAATPIQEMRWKINGETIGYKPGEVLSPTLGSLDELIKQAKEMDIAAFNAQYQQDTGKGIQPPTRIEYPHALGRYPPPPSHPHTASGTASESIPPMTPEQIHRKAMEDWIHDAEARLRKSSGEPKLG